ncbi:hypothetical protein [Nocardia stercoris]|nr:hypothetical protein [Nocardia stercoris]
MASSWKMLPDNSSGEEGRGSAGRFEDPPNLLTLGLVLACPSHAVIE